MQNDLKSLLEFSRYLTFVGTLSWLWLVLAQTGVLNVVDNRYVQSFVKSKNFNSWSLYPIIVTVSIEIIILTIYYLES